MTVTWKGWRMYIDGDLCVATNGTERLTTLMPIKATKQHSFYLATEQLKNDIRNRGPRGSIAQRAAATR
jgi:hypothetical protein